MIPGYATEITLSLYKAIVLVCKSSLVSGVLGINRAKYNQKLNLSYPRLCSFLEHKYIYLIYNK